MTVVSERILRIVGIIATSFLSDDDFSTEEQIVEDLLTAGFRQDEIEAAFGWIESVALEPDAELDVKPASMPLRLFAPQEELLLSSRARGYLTRLLQQGLISAELAEEVIMRACYQERDRLSLREIKHMLTLALVAESQYGKRQIDCISAENWYKLYH
jgi:Smg protein